MSLEALIKHNTAEMNKIVSVLELSLQHRNEDIAQLKHILSVRNSEINTLKGVMCSTQRRHFILQHKLEKSQRVREEMEKENKDLKMVVESLRRKNKTTGVVLANDSGNCKESLANAFKFLQKKYQERLEDFDTLEEEFASFKEKHSQCNVEIKHNKILKTQFKQRPPFFKRP